MKDGIYPHNLLKIYNIHVVYRLLKEGGARG